MAACFMEVMKEKIKEYGSLILILVLVYGGFMLLGFGCPIEFLTGIPCFGCGMTRAVLSLLRFDFSMAFYYHPCVFLLPIIAIWFIVKNKLPKTVYESGIIVIIAIFLITYVVRFFDSSNEIVKIHLEQGFLYQILRKVLSFFVVSLRFV